MMMPGYVCPHCGDEVFVIDTVFSHEDNGYMPVYSDCKCDLNRAIEEANNKLKESCDSDDRPF